MTALELWLRLLSNYLETSKEGPHQFWGNLKEFLFFVKFWPILCSATGAMQTFGASSGVKIDIFLFFMTFTSSTKNFRGFGAILTPQKVKKHLSAPILGMAMRK